MNLKALFFSSALFPLSAFADARGKVCEGAGFDNCGNRDALKDRLLGTFDDLTNSLLLIAAAIAVIVIIVGGIRYIISTGDAARIKTAKDTVFYGIAGLMVAILGFAIINFVINRI